MNNRARGLWRLVRVVLFSLLLSFGVTALVAGTVWWFTTHWTDMLFIMMAIAMWVVLLSIIDPQRQDRKHGATRLLMEVGFLLVSVVAVLDRTYGLAAGRSLLWSFAGLGLCLLAFPLGVSSLCTLGRNYAPDPTILSEQSLVTHGVYRYVRHPMYSSLLLWITGLPLVARSIWATLIAVFSVGTAVILRIREEEEMLLAAFGDAYQAYRMRSWYLIPFLF